MSITTDSIRILHISDLHLKENDLADNTRIVIKAITDDIKRHSEAKSLDFVLFSGDLVNQGGSSFSDVDIAFLTFEEEVIIPIMRAASLPLEKFFFTPGNHDIIRNADTVRIEKGMKAELKSCEAVKQFIEIDSKSGEGIQRLKKFNEFAEYFYGKSTLEKQISGFESTFKFNVGDVKVGISCLNSAWRCYGNEDKENLIIGEPQVLRSLDFIKDCQVKIALVHHNFDWLAEFEREIIEPLITREYQLMFCGHVHQGDSSVSSKIQGDLFISVASGSLSTNIRTDSRKFANGYNVVDYSIHTKEIVSAARRYSHSKGKYDPNTDLGDDFGKYKFRIPNQADISRITLIKTIKENITNSHIEDLNTHLLSYGTDTTAPQNLKDIFVMPKIIDRRAADAEKEKVYSFNDLLSSDESYLLLAGKEFGKTIFLDRILIEILESIEEREKIPVYINFNEIGNSEIRTSIRSYLNVNNETLNSLLADYEFILLLDNLNVESEEHAFKRLENFLVAYPKVKAIATFNQLYEEEIPVQIAESKAFSAFKVLKIESFKSEQIRQLIVKWFSKENSSDLPDKLEKLTTVFQALNLPRTPLAVSIFLWIIEKQIDYRPVNNSTMLENFIERLFKKLDKNEIYSEKFDFKNKERLLADIAYYMFQNNNEHYSLEHGDLLKFITDYLDRKRFDFQSHRILNIFLTKGILVQEHNLIRFRFSCFFQFFLMKKMDFDSKFREYVLSSDHYLHFIDEIDYFTGIKRDQVEILELIINRMEATYQKVSDFIDNIGIDNIFHNDESMVAGNDVPETIKRIKDKKPKDEQIDQMKDDAFDKIETSTEVQKKEEKLDKIQILSKNWVLAAKVLKNTEEVDKEGFKDNAYKSILRCSNTYASLYKIYCDRFLEYNMDDIPEQWASFIMITSMFIPHMHQFALLQEAGTNKLSLVIHDKIEEDFKNKDVSEFERFISVFLYADLKGKKSSQFIKRFIDSVNEKYIKDMCFFKLMEYYYSKNNSKERNEFLEGQIANLLIKAKGAEAGQQREKLMKAYRQRRTNKLNEDKDQLNLALE